MKRFLIIIALVCLYGTKSPALGQSVAEGPVPSDDEIGRILSERVRGHADRVGIVVGIIDSSGRRIIAVGSSGGKEQRPLDGDTLFEIGSITKVFTALLLADMVQRGEVKLSDPVAKYLPPGVRMPQRGGRAITLEDLARHRSALPRLPANLNPAANPKNPYASYSVERLYEFLSSYKLPRDIGSQFEYSNLGGGLLGHVLALAAGKDYETLVRARICQPLGMASTAITLSQGQQARLAAGHDNRYKPTSNWDIPTLAGAGALRSTANDMLSFLAAQLGETTGALGPAIAATRSNRQAAAAGMEIGLGWLILPKKGSEVIWHNGGTGGYRTFAGYDPAARVGVVALTNVSTAAGVDDVGFHFLNPDFALLPPDSPRIQPPPF